MIPQFGSIFFSKSALMNKLCIHTNKTLFLSIAMSKLSSWCVPVSCWSASQRQTRWKKNLQVVSFVFVALWPQQCHVSTLRAGGAACLWPLTWLLCLQLPPLWLNSQYIHHDCANVHRLHSVCKFGLCFMVVQVKSVNRF